MKRLRLFYSYFPQPLNHILLLPPFLETRNCIVFSLSFCVNKHYKKSKNLEPFFDYLG
jgi:hypothetical protein